jgi:hypothetical protein
MKLITEREDKYCCILQSAYQIIRWRNLANHKMNFYLLTDLNSNAISYLSMFLFADYLVTIYTLSRKRANKRSKEYLLRGTKILSQIELTSLSWITWLSLWVVKCLLHTLLILIITMDLRVDRLCSWSNLNIYTLALLKARLKCR